MRNLILWSILLFIQNVAYTWIGRARTRNNVKAAAIASVFSNGVFFASQFLLFEEIRTAHGWKILVMGVLYVASCVAGSVTMQTLLIRIEKRKGEREALQD